MALLFATSEAKEEVRTLVLIQYVSLAHGAVNLAVHLDNRHVAPIVTPAIALLFLLSDNLSGAVIEGISLIDSPSELQVNVAAMFPVPLDILRLYCR